MPTPKERWNAIDSALRSASVQALETTAEITPFEDGPAALPGHHGRDRSHICSSLHNSGDAVLKRRAARIGGCCSAPMIYVTDEGKPKLVMGCCRDRLCPRCQAQRGKDAARRITALVRAMNAPRFATLTLADDGRGLKERADAIAKAFKKLRADAWFKRHCHGGVYGIEVTRGAKGTHWHVHLHLIFDGDYCDHKQLSLAWKKASRGSIIVDIRAVHDRARTAAYISRYVSKPFDVRGWDPRHVAEYATALHGRRLLHTFGSLHGVTAEPAERTPGGKPTHFMVHARTLAEHAADGDERAAHAVSIAARLGPLWAASLGLKHHAEAAGLEPVQEWELSLLVDVCKALNESMYAAPPPPPLTDSDAPPHAWTDVSSDQLALLPV